MALKASSTALPGSIDEAAPSNGNGGIFLSNGANAFVEHDTYAEVAEEDAPMVATTTKRPKKVKPAAAASGGGGGGNDDDGDAATPFKSVRVKAKGKSKSKHKTSAAKAGDFEQAEAILDSMDFFDEQESERIVKGIHN